ncbi:MAG: hypothetical protein J6X39_06025 [Bacteroidales bacterium]|nr:hypothetical protein [Bacteroidales bacterium]
MNTIALQLVVAAIAVLYFIVTLIVVRRKPGLLWVCAALVALGGILLYWQAYAGVKALIPHLVMSILTGLDLFLFRAYTIGMVNNFFFGEGNMAHLVILYGIMLCAVWTTSLAAIHVFARKLESRIWLWFNTLGKSKTPVHLIIGVNQRGISLARSLKGKGRVVVLDDAMSAPVPKGKVDFFSVIRGIRVESPLVGRLHREAPWAAVIKGSLALHRLDRWLQLESTCVYLLSEDLSNNIAVAIRLDKRGKAQIWFAASGNILTEELPIAHPRLHLVDPSALSAASLKREEDLYPVRFVKVARDENGRRLGYVESGFESMVIGFGGCGQGVTEFLYEWGAFVGRDKRQKPLRIDAVDSNMDALVPSFKENHPGMTDGRIIFHAINSESSEFRTLLDERLASLNWVGISLGDDEATMKTALQIAKRFFVMSKTPDPAADEEKANGSNGFVIAVRLESTQAYLDTIHFAKENYGVEIIPFGEREKIWTYDNITGGDTAKFARIFYDGYSASAGTNFGTWEERNKAILASDKTPLWKALELSRKTSQDYSDYFHRKVKMQLCELFKPEFEGVWNDIPVVYEDKHYSGEDPYVGKVLEYLAIGEHLRWEASHRAAGYKPGPAKAEDRKIHTDLVPYNTLSEVAKHYDWIVVRTSLKLK